MTSNNGQLIFIRPTKLDSKDKGPIEEVFFDIAYSEASNESYIHYTVVVDNEHEREFFNCILSFSTEKKTFESNKPVMISRVPGKKSTSELRFETVINNEDFLYIMDNTKELRISIISNNADYELDSTILVSRILEAKLYEVSK